MKRPFADIHRFMKRYEKNLNTHQSHEEAYMITEEQTGRETGKTFYRNYNSFRRSRNHYLKSLRGKGKTQLQ